VYCEFFDKPHEGIQREKVLKGWLRKRKIELIESINPDWRDLYEDL
jgi:putative endonuclease